MNRGLCIVFLFIFSVFSFAGSVVKYSVNVYSEKYKNKLSGNSYYQGKMFRNEIEVPVNTKEKSINKKVISIIRLDKELVWILIPSQNKYVEFTFEDLRIAYKEGDEILPVNSGTEFSKMECKKVEFGEKIESFETIKFECKSKNSSGIAWFSSDKKLSEITNFWKDMSEAVRELEISSLLSEFVPLKITMNSDKAKYEYNISNFKQKKLDESLFEVPKDYKPIDASVWRMYKDSFTMEGMKKAVTENAKEEMKNQAAEKVKDAAKNAIKSLFKF